MSTYDEAEGAPPRPGRGVLGRFAIAGLIIVLATAGATATAALLFIKDTTSILVDNPKSHIKGIDNVLDNVEAGGPQTILMLGSDRRFADIKTKNPVRSDTMILMRLDPGRGATAVMSIPRDLKVDIPYRGGFSTNKINAAYALGGPALAVKTVRALLHIPINHVVNVNFGGFQRAVNRLGCVYVDVDRRYFNDNNPPFGGGPDYASIDVSPGYQMLCGHDALDYVRYRHFDTDLVRAARQQDFLRQAKDQFGLGKLFSDRKELLRVVRDYTQTDIRSQTAVLRLLKLALESAKNPVQEVHFRSTAGAEYVTATTEQIQQTVKEFMESKGSNGARGTPKPRAGDTARKRQSLKHSSSRYPGTFEAAKPAEDQAIRVGVKTGPSLPVYYPQLAALGASYVADAASPRAYRIKDRAGHSYPAYRLVVRAPGLGQYYGIEGTTWRGAPILDNPSETTQMRGRKYELFYDGNRLRMVAWRTPKAVYWVSNTLLQTLKNQQMLGIARSLTRVGS